MIALAVTFAVTACAAPEHGTAVAGTPLSATTTTVAPTTTSTAETTTSTTTEETTTEETTAEETTTAEQSDTVIDLGEYGLRVTGTVAGQPFDREGRLYVTGTIAEVGTTNGVNEIDVCLESGFPAGSPQVGSVWFGSNTGCFPSAGAADIDLAHTSLSGGRVSVEPDETVAAAGLNTFVESAGLAACLYFAVGGGMEVTFDGDGGVTGQISITGYSGPCGAVGTESEYRAEFSGSLL